MTAMDILLFITNDRKCLYYDVFDHVFTNEIINKNHFDKIIKQYGRVRINEDSLKYNIPLPSFREICHEEIMRFFVQTCVEEKETRKTLFYILRRDDFVTPFIEKLKELDLYEDFCSECGNIYDDILKSWAEKHSIEL